MPREIIIVNTSPIFYLHNINLLHLFNKLYGRIIIPEGVTIELEEGKKVGELVLDIFSFPWIRVEKINIPGHINSLSRRSLTMPSVD